MSTPAPVEPHYYMGIVYGCRCRLSALQTVLHPPLPSDLPHPIYSVTFKWNCYKTEKASVRIVLFVLKVGLRWWNYIDDQGESKWVFESRDGTSTLDSLATNFGGKADARLFWIGLVVAPAMWIVFFLTAFFSFSFRWLILVIIGITMSFSNLFGYLRCRLGSTQSISNMANTYMQRQMLSNVMNMFKGKQDATAANPQASNVI